MDCDYIEFTPENLLKIHEDILSLEKTGNRLKENPIMTGCCLS